MSRPWLAQEFGEESILRYDEPPGGTYEETAGFGTDAGFVAWVDSSNDDLTDDDVYVQKVTQSIPSGLENQVNRQVLNHIKHMSAHSDVADALRTALKPLGDVQLFCPDWGQYRYVIASTAGVVFACALGMNAIGLRLDERMKQRAVTYGGVPSPELGDDWVQFTLFRDDWPKVDLEFWARKAYRAARSRST